MNLSSIKYLFIIVLLLPGLASAKEREHFVFTSAQFLGITQQLNGKPYGIAIELLDRLQEQFDFTYEVQYLPWKRALQMAQKQKVDGVIGAYYSAERAEFLTYAKQPVYQDQFVLMSLRETPMNWHGDLTDLHGKSFAILRSASYGYWYEQVKDELDVVVVSSSMQQFELLKLGRVDFIVNNLRTSPVNIKKLGLSNKVRFHQPALSTRDGFFTAAKNSKLVPYLEKFDKYMQALEASGELQRLRQQFLKSNKSLN